MRITFVLPGFSTKPVGGYKIVYEYASRLQAIGHEVTIVHLMERLRDRDGMISRSKLLVKKGLLYTSYGQRVPWFTLDSHVRIINVGRVESSAFPDADAVIATAWQTASLVNQLSEKKGVKFYLIQGYEVWAGPQNEVDATWKLPLHKIVIARWLYDLGIKFGESSRMSYIPNALDFSKLQILIPIEYRNKFRVAMLYHKAEWKGTEDGLKALEETRRSFPELHATLFGVTKRGAEIPHWIDYIRSPSSTALEALYNSAAIFLQPSWSEGWGLTSAEAMACGCALVSTNNQGVQDYAEHEKSALMSPVKDSHALAENIKRLLTDQSLRRIIARNGNSRILKFSWPQAVDRFEKVLIEHVADPLID